MPATAMYSILTKKENAHEDPIFCCAWGRTSATEQYVSHFYSTSSISHEKFSQCLAGDSFVEPVGINTSHEMDKAVDTLVKAITEEIRRETNEQILNLSWWSEELEQMKRKVNTFRRRIRCAAPIRRSKVVQDYLTVKETYKEAMTKARTDSWKAFCCKILDEDSESLFAHTFYPKDTAENGTFHQSLVCSNAELVNEVEDDDPSNPAFTMHELRESARDLIVTGGLDNLVKVWLYQNNRLELLHTLNGHTMSVVSVAISPDGYTLASSSLDCTLIIWDTLSGNKVHSIETGATNVWKLTFSPDGRQVATGSHTGKVMVYGVESRKLELVLDMKGKFALCVAWSVDNKHIASGSVDGVVSIFNVATTKLVHRIEAHTKAVRSIDFSSNSQILLTASDDGTLKVFDVASATLQSTLSGHTSWVLEGKFSKDGRNVASAGSDGTLRIYTVHEAKVLNVFHEHTSAVWGVSYNHNGNKVVSVSKDKCVNIYECPVKTH